MDMKIAVIGYGYWGPNLVRNFSRAEGIRVQVVCDLNPKVEKVLHNIYSNIEFSQEWTEVVKRPDIDAFAVATPVSTHYEIAKGALENGKHVFVEKPFTSKVSQAEKLIEIAQKKNLKIMVDHTFLFTGAVRKIREIIDSQELGSLYFYDSTRVNLGLFQHDINVVWDLAPHDFSIMNYVIDQDPKAISAQGSEHFGTGIEDVAYIAAHFDNGFIAHFHCNWLSPVKIRKTLISGDKKMLVWDDLESDEKIKVYDRGVEIETTEGIHKLLVSYRSGDMYAPKVNNTEALKEEAEYFLECIEKNTKPFNDGEAGLQVVRMLEATDESLKNSGGNVNI